METESSPSETVHDIRETACCVVGGGPAGVMLSLLLARRGIPVTLLEAHKDFDRDFRGDTIHPSTLEILDQLGMADRLLQIPHGRLGGLKIVTATATITVGDFSRLKTRFPFVAMLPQAQFLDFLAREAHAFPCFNLVMGANVQRLVEGDGVVKGVRYRGADDAWHEVHAPLTVAADGRFSKIRSLAGLEPIKTAPPMDVVWFRLPRLPADGADTGIIYIRAGHFAILLERAGEWQVGFVILKGSFQQHRAEGLEPLRRALAETVPWLGERVNLLQEWKQVSVLSVESSRLTQWHKPGLLLIGDAAHVMSPVAGVGINVAIQDAVETANLLAEPLRNGVVRERDLAALQKRRQLPVRVVQAFQSLVQKRIAGPALAADKPFRFPLLMRLLLRLPFFRDLPARLIGFGIRRVRVEGEPIAAPRSPETRG